MQTKNSLSRLFWELFLIPKELDKIEQKNFNAEEEMRDVVKENR